MMIAPSPPITLNNYFQRPRMCHYPLGDAIGWTLDCALGCAREEPGSITNSSIIPRLRPTMKRRTRCSPFLPIPHNWCRHNLQTSSKPPPCLLFRQTHLCSTALRSYSPIMSLGAHPHHNYHRQTIHRSYPLRVPLLRC